MNRFAWTSVVLAGALSGCTPINFVTPARQAGRQAGSNRPGRSISPPVTAGQINGDERSGEGEGPAR